MQKSFLILIISQLILGCNLNDPKPEQEITEFKAFEIAEKTDTLIQLESKNLEITDKCDCRLGEYNRNHPIDLVFYNSDRSSIKNDTLFAKWSQAGLVNQVKSIHFADYDTIPKKFSIFKEVDILSIHNRNGVYGLDIFPQLQTIHFFDSVINLDTDESWLNGIEAIYGQKTKLSGLESFTKTPNLRVMHLEHSGFEAFPKDFDKLDCLYELTLGKYLFGEIDLSELDLSKNNCLQQVEFQTWHNTLSGIPNGILDSEIKAFKVQHQKLTELEIQKLENIKAHL